MVLAIALHCNQMVEIRKLLKVDLSFNLDLVSI